MTRGCARRVEILDIHAYADLVNACASSQALALGRLKNGLPTEVTVVTVEKLNGGDPGTIARTKDYLTFEPSQGGLAPIDFDPKE